MNTPKSLGQIAYENEKQRIRPSTYPLSVRWHDDLTQEHRFSTLGNTRMPPPAFIDLARLRSGSDLQPSWRNLRTGLTPQQREELYAITDRVLARQGMMPVARLAFRKKLEEDFATRKST